MSSTASITNLDESPASDDLTVFIPASGSPSAFHLLAGSAVVAAPDRSAPGSHLLVYFEGNTYGAVNLVTFEQRVRCAASRLQTNYPTTAKMMVAADELVAVGCWSPESDTLTIDRPDLVAAWCVSP